MPFQRISLLKYNKNFRNPCFSACANYPLCLYLLIYAWKFQQTNTVIFVKVRFISLNKNRLIQTKKQSDCKMANKREADPYRRKNIKFQHYVETDKGTYCRLSQMLTLLPLLRFGLQMAHAIVAIEIKPFPSISLCCYGVFGVATQKLLYEVSLTVFMADLIMKRIDDTLTSKAWPKTMHQC